MDKNSECRKKIDLIRKYFRKDKIFLELILFNYSGYYIYVRIDYLKKTKSYKLSWFDLDKVLDNNIDKYSSFEYMEDNIINDISFVYNNYDYNLVDSRKLSDEDLVILKANIKTKISDRIDIAFNRYLPIDLNILDSLFIIVFRYLPKRLDDFMNEIFGSITYSYYQNDYRREFDFDLFNSNLDSIYSKTISERGIEYYTNDRVLYLEKVDDRYFSVVEGSKKYVVVIKYNEEKKKMSVYCSCPCDFYCKHIYAVILSIRNNELKRFCKVMFKDKSKNLLERMLDYDYFLCLDVVDDKYLEIINNKGDIELVPIFDSEGMEQFDILEDTDEFLITNKIRKIIDKN